MGQDQGPDLSAPPVPKAKNHAPDADLQDVFRSLVGMHGEAQQDGRGHRRPGAPLGRALVEEIAYPSSRYGPPQGFRP